MTRKEVGIDQDAPFYVVLDRDTGQEIKGCVMADDVTGEYVQYVTDENGIVQSDENGNAVRVGKIGNIELVRRLGTDNAVKIGPLSAQEISDRIIAKFDQMTEHKTLAERYAACRTVEDCMRNRVVALMEEMLNERDQSRGIGEDGK